MRRLVLSFLLGIGMLACTAIAATALSLCVLDRSYSFYQSFDVGSPRPLSMASDERVLAVFENSSSTEVRCGTHGIRLPLPLLRITFLCLVLLSLLAIGYLLWTLIRLLRRESDDAKTVLG